MKNLLPITCILTLFLGFHSLEAKVIIVNNNGGQPANHVSLDEAVKAAEDGDVIYIVGSPKVYEATTISDKSLTLIGPGYFLGENEKINTQATDETAKISFLTVTGALASNTVISGLDFDIAYNSRLTIEGNCENVVLIRNKINSLNINAALSTTVKENYIDNITLHIGASNTIIWHNIILGNISEAYNAGGLSGTYVKNNTLHNGLSGVDNAKVENNIFITGGLKGCTNNTVQHNIFTVLESDAFPEDPNSNTYQSKGNKFGQPASSLFITEERNLDRDYQLRENSPAKSAGIDGIDAGAFTQDANSYKISGLPAVPAIYDLKTNGVGTPDTGMKVIIKAKSHN